MSNNFATRWLNDIATALRKCASRYPAAVIFIVALTVWCIYLNHKDGSGNDRFIAAFTYYLSIGIPLSIMLQLWSEEMTSRIRRIATHIGGQLLLLADAAFLYLFDNLSLTIGIAHVAAIVAIVVAIFLIPFFKEKNDTQCWNFATRCAIAYIKASVTCLLLTSGINLLVASIGILFDIDFDAEMYFDIAIISNVGLTHLLFIGMLPSGDYKHDPLPRTNSFLKILIRYVFIPLTAAYMLMLYAYAGRILVKWQLPDGYVSLLVTALMVGCVVIEIGLYPFRQFPIKKKSDEIIARWLPLLIMPLLVLMTIGIIRRFDDYGITVMRLYLAAFNAWCYIVCITLFVTRARRISWIPASFAVIFLITSVIPKFNFANITLETLRNDIEEAMKQTCNDTPPLSKNQYKNWINNTLSEAEGQRINDKFIYLQDMYSGNDYNHLAADSIPFYCYKTYDSVYTDEGNYYNFYATLTDGIDIPNGAIRVTEINIHNYTNSKWGIFPKHQTQPIALNENDTIYIDFATLQHLNIDTTGMPYTELTQNNDNFKFILTSISATVNDSIDIYQINGYLFQLKNNDK